MITNKPEAPKCAACENDKPDSKPMSKAALPTFNWSQSGFKVTSGKWTCLVCMIDNEAEASKCAACESDKPSVSKPVSEPVVPSFNWSQSGFKADKATSGKWTCSVCMINNKAEASKCAACESDKPGASKPVSEPMVPSFDWSQSGFKADKAASGKWTCSVCMINNEAEASKCAACESDKPGTSKPVSEPVVPSFNWSQSGFKADKATSGKWTCSVCMINNEAEASKCAACETDKPRAAKPVSEPVVPSFNWPQSGFKADKATNGKWTCSVCMINNDAEASKCAACETDKPGATKPAPEPAAPSFNWSQSGFKMDRSTGSKWTCDVCMINNEAEASKCAACETDKPGGSSSFKTTATGTSLPTASTDNDKFGSVKRSSSGFVFGSSSLPTAPTSFTGGFSLASTNSAPAVPGGFSFKVSTTNSKSSGATFGASSDTTVSGSSLAPSPFTFVVPNTTTTPTLGTTTVATASPAFGVSAFRGSNVGAPSVFGGSTDGSTVFGFGMGTSPSTPFGGAAPMPSPTKLASPTFGSLSGFGNSTFGTSVFGASASTSAFGASSGFGSSSPFGGNVGTGAGTGFGFGGTIAQSSDWQSNNREPGSDDDL
ncbi:hypothetical protein BC936DRAFT_146034 [Jimgerdemannia flammicorona]|uniref:Nuclear pore complex protein Nup153 n=1 Tax=Jimgerdemannia flammicorona TaxID=994334 RepID=A0A433D8K5_9FUNG|nr:hypothetical protein BC936DRAFT_146034 [Jimgerdemannia flammicorona]